MNEKLVAEEAGEIIMELNALERMVERLDQSLDTIIQKLNPVITVSMKDSSPELKTDNPSRSTMVSQRLANSVGALRDIDEELVNLNNRIAL